MSVNVKPGAIVEVIHKGQTYRGRLMPRSQLASGGMLTIKLGSGYDIGLPESEIASLRVIQEPTSPVSHSQPAVVADPSKRTISILSTGGTIASRLDYKTGGVNASFSAADLLESMPELAGIANIKVESIMNVMSEDMNPKLWVQIAKTVSRELNSGADGVVVTHGTDTMHYSSAALSFMLQNLSKPVVFTGSQRSTDRGSADSFLNLASSVVFAKSDYAGVYLVMHGSMSDNFCLAHIGAKVRKMHTTRRDAFQSINSSPAAKIYPDGTIEQSKYTLPKRSDSNVILEPKLEEKVALVKVYPGMDPGIFEYHLSKGIKGVVIEGTALGHVPTTLKDTSVLPQIDKLVNSGVLVTMTTQCLFGRVNPYVYSNLREVSSRGVIYLEDMLPEVAYVKLMWVLGNARDSHEAKSLMTKNLAGELTPKTTIEENILHT